MGNVPISCCRSNSPQQRRSPNSSSKSNSSHFRNGLDESYSTNSNNQDFSHGSKFMGEHRQADDYDNGSQPSHHLQHISEREPDDSETDPSSNPLNRPIFASRSSNLKNKTNHTDSYSSNNSTNRRLYSAPLISSQDYGYSSTTSANLTQNDGIADGSFDDGFDEQVQACHLSNIPTVQSYNSFKVKSENPDLVLSCSPPSLGIVNRCLEEFEDIQPSNITDSRFYSEDLYKSSSCSTIFIDGSTISQPNLEQTIRWVSLAIYYHIKNRTSDDAVEIFDELMHPIKIPRTTETRNQNDGIGGVSSIPDFITIYSFVKTLFKAAQLSSEYAITTLVYLERLMTYAEMDLTPRTWRRMFLGAILLSSKVWEDQAVWNVDYAQILDEISVEDINELERQFLELVQFNTNVQSSVYAKYYFHLRTLASRNGFKTSFELLRVGRARDLEAMSRMHTGDWQTSPIHRKTSTIIKRHTSLERLRVSGQASAILM